MTNLPDRVYNLQTIIQYHYSFSFEFEVLSEQSIDQLRAGFEAIGMTRTKKQRPGKRTADTAESASPVPTESCEEQKDILIIEAFYGGSHGRLVDVLYGALKERAVLYTLTDKKWHWRARTSALYFSQVVPKIHHFRYLFTSAVLNLTELVALRPDLVKLKKMLYFHENQLVYPAQDEKERDFQYGYNQILSALVADVNLFNSQFNMDSFLSSIKRSLSKIPSGRPPKSVVDDIVSKCRVLYFPLVLPLYKVPEKLDSVTEDSHRPLHIVWPHRWEHDKNPDFFVTVLEELHAEDIPFQVSVIGQKYSEVPDSLLHLAFSLQGNLLHHGFLPSKADYYETLKRADIAVSTANHEFFGVAMLEAVYFGCFPLVPNRLVYPELYAEEHLYDGSKPSNLTDILRSYCLNPSPIRNHRRHLDVSRFDWEYLHSSYADLFQKVQIFYQTFFCYRGATFIVVERTHITTATITRTSTMMQKGEGAHVPVRRVNATMLPSMLGKYVCMMGMVENVDGTGRSFRLQSPDKKSVIIRMKEPLGEHIDGLIELEGIVAGQNAIDCHMYTLHGNNNGVNFNLDLYNEAIQIAANHVDLYAAT